MVSIYISLGSNISPEQNLTAAASMLRKSFPGIRFSSVYQTKARDVEDQPDFLNAVAAFESEESPQQIHEKLVSIEQTLKKNPPFRSGPRTIDLDLLLYGDEVINTSSLTVPHSRMHERRFVLEPLSKLLDSTQKHPISGKTWKELLQQTIHQECEHMPIIL